MARRAATRAPSRPRSSSRRGDAPRPSTLDRYLLESERLVFAVRRHGAVLAGAIAIYVLLVFVAALLLAFAGPSGAIATTGLVVLLAATLWFGWKVGDWWVERFTVTDRRVLLVSGLLTRRVAIMPLRKVTDLTFERSIMGRLLGYGAFVMESAGQQQALSRVDYLPRPEVLYLQMSDLLFGSGGQDHDPDEDGPDRRRARRSRRTDRPVSDRLATDRPPTAAPVSDWPVSDWPASDLPAAPRAPGREAHRPRVTSRPPRPPAGRGSAAQPTESLRPEPPGPAPGATAPLPSVARDRPVARRPRGRQES